MRSHASTYAYIPFTNQHNRQAQFILILRDRDSEQHTACPSSSTENAIVQKRKTVNATFWFGAKGRLRAPIIAHHSEPSVFPAASARPPPRSVCHIRAAKHAILSPNLSKWSFDLLLYIHDGFSRSVLSFETCVAANPPGIQPPLDTESLKHC